MLKGRVTLPILDAFNKNKFQLIISQVLLDEFHEVWNRPRLKKYIDINQATRLEKQIKIRSIWIEALTIPPHCRDPNDLPVLSTAIDGEAHVIVSGDDDLRADEELRRAMQLYNIKGTGSV